MWPMFRNTDGGVESRISHSPPSTSILRRSQSLHLLLSQELGKRRRRHRNSRLAVTAPFRVLQNQATIGESRRRRPFGVHHFCRPVLAVRAVCVPPVSFCGCSPLEGEKSAERAKGDDSCPGRLTNCPQRENSNISPRIDDCFAIGTECDNSGVQRLAKKL